MSALLEACELRKFYGEIPAVEKFSHRFAPGKITTILGPSGSGKSTTLGMIAGLTAADGGRLMLDGRDITQLPAERRDFGLVFQNYSLFPHLTVVQNVEFGLRVRRVPAKVRRSQALDALERMQIAHLADRSIFQISGGEQQRTALARAVVFNPRVLLLDEPLSALDAKLRETLRSELAAVLRDLQVTAIYVTHDQIEAMSLGDELVIIHHGRIEQVGPPLDVYTNPATSFVAGFLGSANVISGECVKRDGRRILQLPFAEFEVGDKTRLGPCHVMIRPEDMFIVSAGEHFRAACRERVFLGNQLRLLLEAGQQSITVDVPNETPSLPDANVAIRIKTDKVRILDHSETI